MALDLPPHLIATPLDGVSFALGEAPFAYGAAHASAIAADWGTRIAANPALFNGPFFLLVDARIVDGVLEGRLARTDYASYLHWRSAGYPGGARNAFAMPALVARSGRVLIGRMAGWTANAGRWYPPAGSLDAEDLGPDGRFDLEANMRREIGEELGLDLAALERRPGFVAECLALFALFAVDLREDDLARRIERHLAAQERPEIDAIAFVSGAADIGARDVPPFVSAFLETRG